MSDFGSGFLWGAATAAHQVEGNNLNNDWWKLEHDAAAHGVQFSGDAVDDGIDVRGYLHWSLLDNFEWGRWEPTFGLVAVDRTTFERRPKPSLAWLGAIARANAI